jgi:acetylornithine aminotransferase
VARAVADQAARLVHVSNLYYTKPMIELAEELVKASFAERVFFCNSGAEANEGAIKLTRKYFKDQGQPERFKIITMLGSFHGRTLACLTATGQDKIKKGFDPLPEGFDHVPFNDLSTLALKADESTAAVMMEPVLGEGGVAFPEPGFLKGVRQLCDERGLLLILDEIQTGLGRTGHLFAHQAEGIEPDVMTLAKGMANGLPMGAVLATEKVASAFSPGSHGTTFGGTPLAAAAALAVWRILTGPGFLDQVREVGQHFKTRLEEIAQNRPVAVEVRGRGLMLGLVLDRPGAEVMNALRERGFIVNVTQDKIIRFLPPLIITRDQVDSFIQGLDEVLAEL